MQKKVPLSGTFFIEYHIEIENWRVKSGDQVIFTLKS